MSAKLKINAESKAFPKGARLRSPKEFKSAMDGERRSRGAFSLRAIWNGNAPRLGLIIGARFEPLSPRRNAMKRAAREAFRELSKSLPPVDIALRLAKKSAAGESLTELKARVRSEIRQLLGDCLTLKPPAPKQAEHVAEPVAARARVKGPGRS